MVNLFAPNSFGGHYTIDEFHTSMESIFAILKENGIDGISGGHLYFTAFKGKRRVELRDPRNKYAIVGHLKINEPFVTSYRSTNEHVEVLDDDEGQM